MAKDKLTDYSATNSLNTDVGGVDIDEGCLPSGINNAIREVMTHLKDFAEGTQAVNAVAVDNLKLDANTLSSTNTNGNIVIDPNGTGSVQLGGDLDTNGNDITFGDGDKAIFGAGSDLQVFHDGSNSYIKDDGTGNLHIQGHNVVIEDLDGNNMAFFQDNQEVSLYYNASKKLETTSGGIDVTGTMTADVLNLQDDDASASIKIQAPAAVTTTTTFTLPDGDGADGQALITDGSGTLAWAYPYGNRNLIINGAMQVAQRGTSFSGLSSDQYTLDRWTSSSAGGVSLNVSQQTSTSTDNGYFASKHFARYQRNAVLSGFVHKVEDLQQFNNKTFTLSFWAKSADAGTNVGLTVYTVNDGINFNNYVTKTSVTNPTLSSTWQKYEFRLVFEDIYTYGYSGSHHLRLQFFDGTNAATFDIAEVQLEVGEQATPFEHRSYGDELARCQRYYQQLGNSSYVTVGLGVLGGARTRTRGHVQYAETMRAVPSITISGTLSTTNRDSYETDISSISGSSAGLSGAYLDFAHSATGTAGYPSLIAVKNGTTSSLKLDAEL